MSMFQPTSPDATIPFMEAESITWPENPFLFDISLSPRVLLILKQSQGRPWLRFNHGRLNEPTYFHKDARSSKQQLSKIS